MAVDVSFANNVVKSILESSSRAMHTMSAVGSEGPLVYEDLAVAVAIFQHSEVTGISVGPRIRSDRADLNETVVRFYVAEKKDIRSVHAPIPTFLRLREGGVIPTDVVATGHFIAHSASHTQRTRPLKPGVSVGHVAVTAGTVGCVVKRQGDDRPYLLSNFHILGNDGAAAIGEDIVQPGPSDGGQAPDDLVAKLSFFVAFDFEGTPCTVDAALAAMSEDITFENSWDLFGNSIPVGNQIADVLSEEIVYKIGRTSGLTTGKVLDHAASAIKVKHAKPGGTKRYDVVFADQVICSKYADAGDSGSIVFNSTGHIVGLHMAGNDKMSVFNKIKYVVEAFDIVFCN